MSSTTDYVVNEVAMAIDDAVVDIVDDLPAKMSEKNRIKFAAAVTERLYILNMQFNLINNEAIAMLQKSHRG